MACSKLFSGDLPEISNEIIQNLRNNFNALYSLALVNRFWCRLAIPLLWENPFSVESSFFHFINTYFLFLNENDKRKVKELKLYEFDLNFQKPLFNYPSLIKTLNIFRLHVHVTKWFHSTPQNTTSASSNKKLLACLRKGSTVRLDRIRSENIDKIKFICIALFSLFIENDASLNSLYIDIDDSDLTIQLYI